MTDSKSKAEDIPFMLLKNGKITSNMDFWIGGIHSTGYQDVAKCPPISVSKLTQNLLDSITVSLDPEDADALIALSQELETSLDIVTNTISKLRD